MIQAVSYNLVTGAVQEDLPFTSLSFDTRLNDGGTWSMKLPLSFEVEGYEKMQSSSVDVNQSCVVIMRDGVALFAGLVTTEKAQIEQSESFQMGGPDAVWGYLDRRQLFDDYSVSNTDQFTIARHLVEDVAGVDGIGIFLDYVSLSGVLRDRTWYGPDRQVVGKLLRDLTALQNGFDAISIVTGDQHAGFRLSMTVGYPWLLRNTNLVLGLSKNMTLLNYEREGKQVANRYSTKGSGSGVDGLVSTISDDSKLLSYPRYDAVESRASVLDTNTLRLYSAKGLDLYSEPRLALTVQVDPDDPDSQLGSFRCGDSIRVIAKRGRIQVDDYFRVNSYSYAVDENGAEKLQLTLTEAQVTS